MLEKSNSIITGGWLWSRVGFWAKCYKLGDLDPPPTFPKENKKHQEFGGPFEMKTLFGWDVLSANYIWSFCVLPELQTWMKGMFVFGGISLLKLFHVVGVTNRQVCKCYDLPSCQSTPKPLGWKPVSSTSERYPFVGGLKASQNSGTKKKATTYGCGVSNLRKMCNDDSVQFHAPSEAAERLLASEVVHVSKIHPLEISHAMQIRLHVEFLELLGPNITLIVSRNGFMKCLVDQAPSACPNLGKLFHVASWCHTTTRHLQVLLVLDLGFNPVRRLAMFNPCNLFTSVRMNCRQSSGTYRPGIDDEDENAEDDHHHQHHHRAPQGSRHLQAASCA